MHNKHVEGKSAQIFSLSVSTLQVVISESMHRSFQPGVSYKVLEQEAIVDNNCW